MGSFQKATKDTAKLRLAIAGPAGSGKTFTALLVADVLKGDKRIAVIDTEHGSASKYADLWDFDTMAMQSPYDPRRFVKGIQAAEAEGYGVVIIDSISHAWNGSGGVLNMVEDAATRMKTTNKFAAWREVTPIHDAMIEGMLGAGIHVIVTMRSKTEYVLEVDDRGRKSVQKRGLAPIQRDGFEYEFDVLLDMDPNNQGVVTKTRCPALTGGVFNPPGQDFAIALNAWLTNAEDSDEDGMGFVDPQERPQKAKVSKSTKGTFPSQAVQESPENAPQDLPDEVPPGQLPGTVAEEDPEQIARKLAEEKAKTRPDLDGWVNSWLEQEHYPLANQWGKERLKVGEPGGVHKNHFTNGWTKTFKEKGGKDNPAVFLPCWRKWVNQKLAEQDAPAEENMGVPAEDGQLSLADTPELPF